MDAFSYLSVLLSIIVGLAITQVLQGYRSLLLNRARVSLYAPALIWSVLILIMATQVWWSSFGLSDYRGWTFATFTVLLLQMVLLYMMAGVVLPDMPAGEAVDLAAHYHREVTPLFTLLIAILATSIAKDWMLDGRLPMRENLVFHGVFAGASALALAVRRRWLHQALAIGMAALFVAYIALLFARL